MMLDTSSYDCKGCDHNVECTNTSDQQTIAILNMTLNSGGTVYFQCSSLMYSHSVNWPNYKQIEIFSNVMKLIVKEGMCSICTIFCI